MKRKLVFDLLLVLLILYIMPLFCPNVVDSGVIVPPRNPSTSHDYLLSNDSHAILTWTSRQQTDPLPVENNSLMSGDHVTLTSSWDIPVLSSQISFNRGFNETRYGYAAPPLHDDEWPVCLCLKPDYISEIFRSVSKGDHVRITLNMSKNGDPSFAVWSLPDAATFSDISELETIGTRLFAVDDYGASAAESISFLSNASCDFAVLVYAWPWAYSENMTYELSVSSLYSIIVENEEATSSRIEYDTYNNVGNSIFNLTLEAWDGSETRRAEFRNLTFENYFAPNLTIYNPIDLGAARYNLTWLSVDPNSGDTNYFSVWLSSDGGVTYQLLTRNLTNSFFVWDSSGFLVEDYIVRVVAYSLDFSNPLCRADNPPSSYWPGDMSVETVLIEAGDMSICWPPLPPPLTLNSPLDITYTLGSTGHQIVWTHSSLISSSYPYVVTKNGLHYKAGSSTNNRIVASIDDLPVGVYEFVVTLDSTLTDSVIVYVVLPPDALKTVNTSLLSGLARGVSVGSVTIIVMSGIFISRLLRKRKVEMELLLESTRIDDPYSILMSERE